MTTFEMAVKNGIQSSSFMATYVFIFQIVLCLQRNLISKGLLKEWKYSYWLMGFISSLSILIEKKSRRSELVLYVIDFPIYQVCVSIMIIIVV